MEAVRRGAGPAVFTAFAAQLSLRVASSGRWQDAAVGLVCWAVCGGCLWMVAAAISWRLDRAADLESRTVAGRVAPPDSEAATRRLGDATVKRRSAA